MSPLLRGKSRQIIGENISEARRSGYPEAQAVAMSLNQARKSGAKIPKKRKKQKKNANEAEKQNG